MTRRYEIVYIFDSAMDEAQVNASLEKHHTLLKPNGDGDFIQDISHWGRRSLAYPIGNREVGYYVVVQLTTSADRLPEFERAVKLDESIVRFLVVLNEGKVSRPIAYPDEDTVSNDEADDDDGNDGNEGDNKS